jgi:ATP-dependent helicase HrpB
MVERALTEEDGNILVFLTGAAEIRAAERALSVPEYVEVAPLYGALPFKAQQAAIRAPQMGQRKVVLSTAIAETSLTIEGIRVVVDAGLARVSRFDPNTGMARLVTEKVSRAAADQRQGRAGRLEPGVCYRLWTRGEHGALPAFSAPEITTTDLAPLALELARWGSVDVPFLTPPPRGMLAEAQSLLRTLGALDRSGGMTAHGKALAAIPAHPRLAHMILSDGAAVDLAALLQGRDVLQRDSSPLPVDLGLRLRALRDPQRFRGESPHAVDPGALAEARAEAKRLKRFAGPTGGLSAGAALALAYPDRIALRRSGDAPRYIMSGGSGAVLPASDALAGQRMLVLADLDGNRTEATVRAALPIAEAEVKALFPERLDDVSTCIWSRRHKRVEARVQVRLGALILEDQAWRDPPENSVAEAATQGVEDLGLASLGWSPAARRFQARALYARHGAVVLPDLSDEALLASLRGWLTPYLGRCRTAADLRALDPIEALQALVPWEATQEMDRLAPEQFRAPTGTRAPITYDTEAGPGIDIRLQEMFGVTVHPTVGAERIPLRITLLSPARRPVQTTSDLPRFWSTSYADVRKDMRGRYPKHPWPEDPRVALPTTRTKPRGK